ncbi:DUF4062 domain-containing protein [Catellatospora chokoriensis]|uniref:ATPase n=1 Tax=Catellatospora chokoriensis TaxID=310353 RepID=A0A8J3K864_9ACTN|nr:DUF4062 domain-containing protein [Catellatospora chokoriensis]GIF91938.1 hypothetical protein Cch02nite_53820 [Catellatospora chokoriensis]
MDLPVGGAAHHTHIRTPDQRLRVFVSSTLRELAVERRAVERAVTAMRLTPVMFELGARPHPPRDLYRAYLAQSDVFIGLYWQEYGWVGPDMAVSGLQDELELSRDLPRLLYVKTPADDRDPRLADMLAGVEQEAATSYRLFTTATELGRLVRDDLATLLSERFAAGASAAHAPPAAARARFAAAEAQPIAPTRGPRVLPMGATSLVGREPAIEEVAALLDRPEVRLVTLTGPGGIGKSRLALAVADRIGERFTEGTVFVSLAEFTRPDAALAAIGRAVGASIGAGPSPLDAIGEHLGDDRWLIVLDNVEQVDLAHSIDELLTRCPGTVVVATSRRVLRLRAEWEYEVQPLSVPDDPDTMTLPELAAAPAVALFAERARAVRRGFALTEANVGAVVRICRLLDGIPLAIELASARIRLKDPEILLAKLTDSLGVLGAGPVDLPERQRTLRATVEWSVGILPDAERRLLQTMAVFVDGWTVDAAAHVAGLPEHETLELIDTLHQHSLVHVDITEAGPRSRLLVIVRDFAAEQLSTRDDGPEVHRRHAEYFRQLAGRADHPLRGAGQHEWGERLQTEAGNLSAAVRWHLAHDPGPLPHLFRQLWPFWSLWEHLAEIRPWVRRLSDDLDAFDLESRVELLWTAAVLGDNTGDDAGALWAYERLGPLLDRIGDPFLRAMAHLAMAWTAPLADDLDRALREALASLELFRDLDEPFWTALVLTATGTMQCNLGRHDDAAVHLAEADELARRIDNAWLCAWVRSQRGIMAVEIGHPQQARELLDQGLTLGLQANNVRSLTLCLAGYAQLAAGDGDFARATLLGCAADALRRRTGIHLWPMLRRHREQRHAQMRAALGDERYEQICAAGGRLGHREAIAAVNGELDAAVASS